MTKLNDVWSYPKFALFCITHFSTTDIKEIWLSMCVYLYMYINGHFVTAGDASFLTSKKCPHSWLTWLFCRLASSNSCTQSWTLATASYFSLSKLAHFVWSVLICFSRAVLSVLICSASWTVTCNLKQRSNVTHLTIQSWTKELYFFQTKLAESKVPELCSHLAFLFFDISH